MLSSATYRVYIPDAPQQEQLLPSDKYNFWNVQKQALNTPPRQSFGLFGTVTASEPPTPPHPEPYAEISLSQSPPAAASAAQQQQQPPQRARGQVSWGTLVRCILLSALWAEQLVGGRAGGRLGSVDVIPLACHFAGYGSGDSEDGCCLRHVSQSFTTDAAKQRLGRKWLPIAEAQVSAGRRSIQTRRPLLLDLQALMQGQIQFRSARARAAILNNYKPPPMAEPPQPRGLQSTALPAGSGLGAQAASGQRTLQEMWARPQQQQQQAAGAAGPQDMEMD
jgi:hypothetical protein